jgi:hypothetical protein
MTQCQPACAVPALIQVSAVLVRVRARGGCCTPQRLIDAAHGTDTADSGSPETSCATPEMAPESHPDGRL